MSEYSPVTRQNEELEVLQAIYGDAVVDNHPKIVWDLWRPLDLLITLPPLQSSDEKGVHCSVTLRFKCCVDYPTKPPIISINKMQGLSNESATKLLAELNKMAQELCGEVMIFQLAQHTQQFLYDHNTPPLSFYDEMLTNKSEMEKIMLYDKKHREDKKRLDIKYEVERRQEMLKAAKERAKMKSNTSPKDSKEGAGDATELMYYADHKLSPTAKAVRSQSVELPCNCNISTTHMIRVTQRNNKKLFIGKCLGHSSNGATSFLAIDEDSGERLVAKKWFLPTPIDFQSRTRQLTLLQQDLRAMCRIEHTSLVPYIAMETLKEKGTVNRCIYIFRPFILGSSLKHLRSKWCLFSDKFEALRLLRHVGVGIYSALCELHSLNVTHKDIRMENVFLDDSGVVKLVGASLDTRLSEMMERQNYCDRQTKGNDIYASALLLLSIVSEEGNLQEIPPELPSSAKDFFSKCLTEDEHTQWTAKQLISHCFLVDVPTNLPNRKQKHDAASGSEDDDTFKDLRNLSLPANGSSRLDLEFEILTWIGKGGFGDVLKVKNKLDGGFYAIKRVKLNPENVQLNKKITREVKLLSRLNHENVVRYYNAWIESMCDSRNVEKETENPVKSPKKRVDSLENVVAKLGQEVKVEWSISEVPVQKLHSSSDSEDDDEGEQDPWFNIKNPEENVSIDITFGSSSNKSETISSDDNPIDTQRQPSRLEQVLYIQMEFCEKHTLRQAIDNGLYQEHFRAWRLFREIVEGLAHVHQRGMIHRDLKPVNIFLDSNDHVKIGDFGLATKLFNAPTIPAEDKQEDLRGSLTGQIGTALYVAPELLQSVGKVIYNQKVDIYSLGIILFEIFHPPLNTGMERILILNNLRSKNIVMPKIFDRPENSKQIHVIRWLLNHDASLRPTCAELLSSEHVPRSVPEGTFSGLLSHALSDRASRGYERLIAACLDQRVSAAEDFTYHSGIKTKPMEILSALKDIVSRIFRSHGATEFSPPLLIPRAKFWNQSKNAVKLMTSSGSVCHLPHDLRLPFARHTAYCNTRYMRRYVIDRVFRERHLADFHPREMIECAFDIVTPKTDYLWSDAELLLVASRVASESSLKVQLRLNHTELLKTLLVSCGVSQDKHEDVYPVLHDVTLGRMTSLQLQTHLTSLCITDNDEANLIKLMDTDTPVHDARELIMPMVPKSKYGKIVAQALHELEVLYRNAKALGCECPMSIVPMLAYNVTQHSGVFWQMAIIPDTDGKTSDKNRSGELIAAGGRYDTLVRAYWMMKPLDRESESSPPNTSVGFSMSLERMAAILKKSQIKLPTAVKTVDPTLICVCVWGNVGSNRDGVLAERRATLSRKLWSNGYTCCTLCVGTPDARDVKHEAHELCGATVVLQQDGAYVWVDCWEGNGVRELKVAYVEIEEFIKNKFNSDTSRSPDGTNRSLNWFDTEKSNSPNISITYITASERINKGSKKHCDNQINIQITSILTGLGLQSQLGRVRVSALALACEAGCVRTLAASLTAPLRADELPTAFRTAMDTYTKRQKILDEALNELLNMVKQNHQNRSTDEVYLYALYSIPDSLCRIII